FLARVLGAYVLDIVICEIAVLKRHCNPVHAGSGAFLRASSWCRNASGSCRHEGATTKRCHIDLPGLLELGGGQAKMCNNIADRVPPTLVLFAKVCKPFAILQGQLASFTPFALVWDMPLLRLDSAEGLERRMTIALRNERGRLPGHGHVRVGSSGKISLRAYRVRFIPVNRSGSRHSGSAAQWHNRTHAPRQSCTVRQCRQPASRCLLLS